MLGYGIHYRYDGTDPTDDADVVILNDEGKPFATDREARQFGDKHGIFQWTGEVNLVHVARLSDLPIPSENDDDEENEGADDVCDLCMTSGVHVQRTTYCGKTIGIECGCEDEHPKGDCGNESCEMCAAALQHDE